VASVAVGAPLNGMIELAGPEPFRLDDLVRRKLSVRADPREVVADPGARYFGAALSERTLMPGDDAAIGEIRFVDWLGLSVNTPGQLLHYRWVVQRS